MAKPRLEKVWALFYVLQYMTKRRGCAHFDTAPFRLLMFLFLPLPHLYDMEPENCYTIGEIAQMFGVTERTVYEHIRAYSIPIRYIGNYVYAPKPDIDNLYKDITKK